jgi:hypothetical protein
MQAFPQSSEKRMRLDFLIRQRFEAWDGMNARNYGDDSPEAIGKLNDKLLLQRIIAGFAWSPSDQLTFSAHLQDSRAFGWSLRKNQYPNLFKIKKAGTSEPSYTMNPNEEFFELYDVFIEYRNFVPGLSAKLGRQKIFYGDYHIFGPGDWGNTGRWTWDALKVSYQRGKHSFDLFAGGTKTHDPVKLAVPFSKTEYWGGGFYGNLNLGNYWNIDPFYAYKTQGSAEYIRILDFDRHWTGFRFFNNNFHSLIMDMTAVRQFGKEQNEHIDAFGWFAKVGYQFINLPGKPILSLRESYASGGRKSDPKIRSFEPAFGASDKYYGWMNIVTWSNLDDREVVLELFPMKELWVEMKFNRFYFPVPEDVRILGTMQLNEGQHHLGDEFDLFLRWQISREWQLVSAAALFWPGDLQSIAGKKARKSSWMALQLLFTLKYPF